MRGTDGITVGRTSPALSTIFSIDSTKAAVAPWPNQTASITLAKEWAMGRKSRTTSSGWTSSSSAVASAS